MNTALRVGVFLEDMPPEAGGGFTFTHSVLAVFLEKVTASRHQYVLFCPQDYARRLARVGTPANVQVVGMKRRGVAERVLANLRHYLPISAFVFRGVSALERLARRKGVQVMWFVGGFHDTIDIPYVSTVWDLQHRTHPWFPEFSSNWVWDHRELYYGRHLRRASRLIVGTDVGRLQVQQFYGVPVANIGVLPHPTPAFALSAARSGIVAPRSVAEPFVLYPAQFWAHKNHMNLLLAWRELIDRGHDPPLLVFVGSDKGNRHFVERRVRELGLHAKVRFMGFVSTDELVALYQHAHALVYPSFSGPENLPPLEAFALGCLVVASEFPGAREQLGEAAIYFAPHSPASLADAMLRTFGGDPELRQVLTDKGREIAAQRNGDSFVLGILALLDEFEAERRCWP